jgi:superfamily II DNA/RNA helicase
LDNVINLDLPDEYTTYVHRIGRTGRLREGTATSFFDPDKDLELAKDLLQASARAF